MRLSAVRKRSLWLAAVGVSSLFAASGWGANLDTIGVTGLRAIRPDLTGAGVTVGQMEATTYTGPATYDPQYDANDFEYDPSVNANVAPTYVGKSGISPTTTFNAAYFSGHANLVAGNLFGTTQGAAPGIAANVTYDANYFYNNVVVPNGSIQAPLAPASAFPVSIVNQSWTFGTVNSTTQQQIEQYYDNFIVTHNVIVVSAAGNSGQTQLPSTAYNTISVSVSDAPTSFGPTSDGRSKPDIAAPGGATSFSTPYVSGIAALLVQAGRTGSGGGSSTTESAAVDPRTVKALLLTGANKTPNWKHTTTAPLDVTFGAGVVDALSSYETLAGGQKLPAVMNTSQTPVTGSTVGNAGWDLNTISTQPATTYSAAHYLLNITANSTLSSTLTWDRPVGAVVNGTPQITGINNLDLMLYNSSGTLVDSSVSTVDNVQYLFTRNLTPGTYDLEVVKQAANKMSWSETYGLAFNAMMAGDTNLDGTVDSTDLATVVSNFGKSTAAWTDGNFDGSSTIDLTDLADVLNNFGKTSANLSAAAVAGAGGPRAMIQVAPEPGTAALVGGAVALLLGRRRR